LKGLSRASLLLKETSPLKLPTTEVLRRTEKVSVAPGARLAGRPSAREKPAGTVIAPRVRAALPVLRTRKERTTGFAPRVTVPKLMGVARPSAMTMPLPVSTLISGARAVGAI
jgi:hypothetical protein